MPTAYLSAYVCGSSGRFIFIARGYLFISLTAGPIYGMTAFTVRVIKLFGPDSRKLGNSA